MGVSKAGPKSKGSIPSQQQIPVSAQQQIPLGGM